MMRGYWNRPDANQEIKWFSAGGKMFLRTGDLGEMDTDGYVTLRGRSKDMIVSGGLNVFPVDIEAVLLEHVDVQDCAVIGVPDEKWGETPVAYLIPQDHATIDADVLVRWINGEVNRHERVREVVIQPGDFPRNTLGKVLPSSIATSARKPSAPVPSMTVPPLTMSS